MTQSEESVTRMMFTAFLATGIDSSLALRMTFNVLCHYDALPYPVIQSGSNNAV